MATPSFPGTKYGEITISSCLAERIRAAKLLAIVTSSLGEVSLAILAGRSASTVAGTQVSCRRPESSSPASQLTFGAARLSRNGGASGSAPTGDATEAIGYAYLLFQNASNDADNPATMAPAATTSRSMKL